MTNQKKPFNNIKKRLDSSVMVIFGFSGDLARRYLIPALYHLERHGLLDTVDMIYGAAGSKFSKQELKKLITDAVKSGNGQQDRPALLRLQAKTRYISADFKRQSDLKRLLKEVEKQEKKQGVCHARLFYLAVPPSLHGSLAKNLQTCGFLAGCQAHDTGRQLRLLVEKPFGHDLNSAKKLNTQLLSFFKEEEIFRIDHYLGKETVQNLMVTRFANSIFEPIWNHKYIDHVQITVAEQLGMAGRGRFYDLTGALRDVVQNHMLQVLALVAMEQPLRNEARYIHDEKTKVLRALRRMRTEDVKHKTVRAQYTPGSLTGKKVPGYKAEDSINKRSRTETYVALKIYIDNERWSGVPFYLRTGKRLPKKVSEISVHFKAAPQYLFKQVKSNVLTFSIQPDEGIYLNFTNKKPGFGYNLSPVSMAMGWQQAFEAELPDAYERLLLDWIQGDRTLFIRSDGLYAAWDFVTSILKTWQKQKDPLPTYKAGSWGPPEARNLMYQDGRDWRFGC